MWVNNNTKKLLVLFLLLAFISAFWIFRTIHTKALLYAVLRAGSDVARKEDAVFLADDGEPLTHWAFAMLFKRLKKRTGIDGKRVSAHNCRRYMATTQLASGRSLLDVHSQMGHTTLHMTNKYASLTIDHLKKPHERHSPLRADMSGSTEAHGVSYWDE